MHVLICLEYHLRLVLFILDLSFDVFPIDTRPSDFNIKHFFRIGYLLSSGARLYLLHALVMNRRADLPGIPLVVLMVHLMIFLVSLLMVLVAIFLAVSPAGLLTVPLMVL